MGDAPPPYTHLYTRYSYLSYPLKLKGGFKLLKSAVGDGL